MSRTRRRSTLSPSQLHRHFWIRHIVIGFIGSFSYIIININHSTSSNVFVQAQKTTCNRIGPAVIRGNKIYNEWTGEYLPIRGIDYYPRPNFGQYNLNSLDFYSAEFEHIWSRDIPILQELGVNAIRLYAVDPSKNHIPFMCALQEAGIYVMVGLAAECENCSINRDAPPDCYPAALKQRGQFIINTFSKYPNVLGFSAGNEVNILSAGDPARLGVCQKQFLRDMREHVQRCGPKMRQIPVGVVLADVDRDDNSLWFGCRSDPNDDLENAEFVGINVYLHCDGGVTDPALIIGYNNLIADFERYNLGVPVMLTEYGCLNESFEMMGDYEAQRNFLQLERLFSSEFAEGDGGIVGGFVFEYSTERQNAQPTSAWPFTQFGDGNYGVGYFTPEFCNDDLNPETDVTATAPTATSRCFYERFPQFDNLKAYYNNIDMSFMPNLDNTDESDSTVKPTCPAVFPPLSSFEWPADSVDDLFCPPGPPEFIFTCPNTPPDCLPTPVPSMSFEPTDAPPTSIPSMSFEPTNAPPTSTPSMSLSPTEEDGTRRPVGTELPTRTSSFNTFIPPVETFPPPPSSAMSLASLHCVVLLVVKSIAVMIVTR